MRTTLISRVAQKHLAAQPPGGVHIPVTALASWSGASVEEHDVFVIPDPYNQGGGPVVVIDNTGGRWYAKDFLRGSGRLAIDYGAGYWLDNADAVRAAVTKYLADTKPAAPADPQELAGLTREFVTSWTRGMDARQLRRKLRDVLDSASPFVSSLFGERDGVAFKAALGKLRSVEASTKTAGDVDVLDYIVKQRDVLKLIDEMEDAGDKQSADLVRGVYMEIRKKLRLSDNEEYALKRLVGCVQHVGSWDAATQRNNIFKAADLLGMKLPSYMFASDKTAVGIYDDLDLDSSPNVYAKVRAALQDIMQEQNELARRSAQIRSAWDRKNIDLLVKLGVFTEADRKAIRDAWEAQQAGDEDLESDLLANIRAAAEVDDLLDYPNEKRLISNTLSQARYALADAKQRLDLLANGVQGRGGQSAPKLHQAVKDIDPLIREIVRLLRLVR